MPRPERTRRPGKVLRPATSVARETTILDLVGVQRVTRQPEDIVTIRSTDSQRDDAVLPTTRLLAQFIIPFLVVGCVVLYGFPGSTGRLFAWTIRPTMTPMVLASAYAGGVYFFFRVQQATLWHTIKIGFVPVTLFASCLGVATIVHWEKFNHSHVAFWLWSGLYFTTPFIVLGVFLRNRPRNPGAGPGDLVLSPVARLVIGVTGVAALVLGLFLFLWPEHAIDAWPWTLTPLTARVMGAVLMLGVAGIGVSIDPRWSTARLMLEVEGLMVTLILVAAVRAHGQFRGARPLTWMLAGGLVAVLAGSIGVHHTMERRAAAAVSAG